MDFLQIVLITIQVAAVFSKRHESSSEESSIENLLYYKDCQRKAMPKKTRYPPIPLRQPIERSTPRAFECPFPKMCCSMTCNNECSNGAPTVIGRSETSSPMALSQPSFPPRQPELQGQPPVTQLRRRKKVKPGLLPPIGGRRDFGFTKERIKSLIAKDDDIRKILKDLVRVTMQKVDLVTIINSRKNLESEVNKELEMSSSEDLE